MFFLWSIKNWDTHSRLKLYGKHFQTDSSVFIFKLFVILVIQAGNPAYGRFTSAEEGPSPFGSIALWEHHPLGASPLGSFTFMELNPQGAIPLGEQQT